MDEDELLAEFPSLFSADDPSVVTGSGPDDCAHVRADGQLISLSIDAFAEGSHFLPDADPAAVARKALGASLSDLAASACRARWALVSLCLHKGVGAEWSAAFARGLAQAAKDFGVAIVGGDTVSSPTATVVSVTVAGEPLPGGPVLRSGGRAGDVLAVTGTLGGSLAGRHLRPEPRLREIRHLMEFCATLGGGVFPSAAMDISDGLALDLSRLCRESGVGAVVEETLLPVSDAALAMAGSPVRHALSDGEDFELLVAVPPAVWAAFERHAANPAGRQAMSGLAPFTRIGELRSDRALRLRTAQGELRPLIPEGYQHQW